VGSNHHAALIAAEESGYAKGIADLEKIWREGFRAGGETENENAPGFARDEDQAWAARNGVAG